MAAHQASSSSSSAVSSTYEVFLSFHGGDVRTTFADYLYNSLLFAGIRTFRDENELPEGNKIAPELLAAIQQSTISIPIISENYPKSKWCMIELAEIYECRRTKDQMVLPIFYKVEPRDVRNQTGIYEKAMREVGALKGWHCKEGTYEGNLIKEVVTTVWSTLNKRSLVVSNNLVGIEFHVKEMLMLLDIDSNSTKIVGIHGLGGIGKTTIARAVYNKVIHSFEEHSFIENIQEKAQKYGIPHLQKQLISDILKQGNQNITSVDDGIKMIQQRLCNKRVLIVLDDVDQDNQAKSLVGDYEWFGIGSKIIITSRNKDVTRKADGIYEPDVMNLDDSLKLFSHHAFGMDRPPKDHLSLSKAMVETTGGLPLSLEVIGSSLYLKEKPIWEEMLKKLQKVPHDDVMQRLRISYDGLIEEQQQMFLDTTCFFIRMNKDIACYIWEGCGFLPKLGLDALCVRCLVKISEEGELWMHDHLRDLGREIVRQESIDEPGERTRIWSQEDVLEIMNTQTGTSNVKGLSINFISMRQSQYLTSEGFDEMKKLKLLQVDYAQFSGNFTHHFPELRWLSWKGCYYEDALANFCPRKLAVLDLSNSEITEKWMGWNFIKKAAKLKVLNLAGCYHLSRIPDLSENRQLEVLILNTCETLVEIDTSIGCLKNLITLDMSLCKRLKDLPIEVCKLTSLERLDLSGCWRLNKLPEKLGDLISLKTLKVSGCDSCETVVDLPMLSSLKNLEVLWLFGFGKLRHLSNLPSSLTTLEVQFCESIKKISCTTSGLRNLERLYLDNCESLEEIDEGLDSLVLCDIGSTSLKKLPNLSNSKNLKFLKSYFNSKLSKIESLEGCESLETLLVYNSPSLKIFPDVSTLKNLTDLEISECESMERLPDLSSLNKLQKLEIQGLTAIPGLDRLEFLENLKIDGCKSLERLPDLSNLKKLKVLSAEGCTKLTEIHGLDCLESLENLNIDWCKDLERLPDLSNLKKLKVLSAKGCTKLTEIQAVNGLESLYFLDVMGCISLRELPDLTNFEESWVHEGEDWFIVSDDKFADFYKQKL